MRGPFLTNSGTRKISPKTTRKKATTGTGRSAPTVLMARPLVAKHRELASIHTAPRILSVGAWAMKGFAVSLLPGSSPSAFQAGQAIRLVHGRGNQVPHIPYKMRLTPGFESRVLEGLQGSEKTRRPMWP